MFLCSVDNVQWVQSGILVSTCGTEMSGERVYNVCIMARCCVCYIVCILNCVLYSVCYIVCVIYCVVYSVCYIVCVIKCVSWPDVVCVI